MMVSLTQVRSLTFAQSTFLLKLTNRPSDNLTEQQVGAASTLLQDILDRFVKEQENDC